MVRMLSVRTSSEILNMSNYEAEWQFDAADLALVRGTLESRHELGGFQLRRARTRELTDCYLDTPDARMAHAGFALRLRSEGARSEATLKSLRAEGSDPMVRKEYRQPVDGSSIATLLAEMGPVSDRTRAVIGEQPLRLLLKAQTHRDVYQVMDGEVEAAEIDLDETRFGEAGDVGAPLQRVEVEVRAASAASLRPLLEGLRDVASLVPATRSKLESGLAASGEALPVVGDVAPLLIAASMPAVAVGQALLQRYIAAWRSMEPAVRLGEDPEALHQLRVTGRRMIAALRLSEAASLGGALGLRRRLQSLLRRLGTARDLDVQRAELEEVRKTLAGAELEPAIRELNALRAACQRRLLRLLGSPQAQRLLAALEALSRRTPARQRHIAIGVVAPGLLRHHYRRLRRRARRAIAQGTVEDCHQLRLEAKKLRYIAEPLVALYGAPLQRFLRRLQKLQTVLGRMNDSHHAMLSFERIAHRRRRLPVAAIFAMGRAAERQRRQFEDSLKAVGEAWQRVRGRSWRRLRRSLEEQQRTSEPLAPTAG
jgi:CHAD domain-containing protein